MKKTIRRGLLPIFLAVICGAICGKLVCDIYLETASSKMNNSKIYLIQAGAYSNYDNMIKNTSFGNYVYYEDDDGLYKAIIGVTEKYENIDKIKSVYDGNVIVNEYYSMDNQLNNRIREYDKKIDKLDDKSEIKKVVLQMLELYKDNDDNTLIKID